MPKHNRFASPAGEWVPLYEGKMVQAFDHRAASITVNPDNLNRPAQPMPATPAQLADPTWLPTPQYWVPREQTIDPNLQWLVGFKEITAPTNARTMIASILPAVGFGNKIPIFIPDGASRHEWLLLANFNSIIFDFVARQKIQGQTLNLFILEQAVVVPPRAYFSYRFGPRIAYDIVRDAVLELSYTANDLAPFAQSLGYVDSDGAVRPPFIWDEDRRLRLRAKLDALFFILYGAFDPANPAQGRDDVRYIYSTFPIVERSEVATYGRYRSRDLCLAWLNALAAGHPDAEVEG